MDTKSLVAQNSFGHFDSESLKVQHPFPTKSIILIEFGLVDDAVVYLF